ncbi:23S rRNA (adenine(2503)-C(2))-methyltransferase RlmN [Povalibacter sp.]|uniref:23S rRNA (adenine(2503)-C(2))-methyltransferase RlmN n=1 Tax=Povalibacter sp. TaxID=1962978 RepID=UPI002F412A5E
MNPASPKTNLLGLTRSDLEAFIEQMGEKPFRARQLLKWLYKRAESDFDKMTDLAKSFRERLKEVAEVRTPEIRLTQVSSDGTRKWLLSMASLRGKAGADEPIDTSQAIEMVFIPEPGRGTLCISSQLGCAMDCTFCSTAQQGFNRNLSVAEIVGQVWLAIRELGFEPGGNRVVTNIVFMGMGEPLANYRNVVPATEILMDDLGFDISRRRVTVSTSGLVPQMLKLAEETNCALAVSLHAPNDELRDELVPINRKHKIAELLDACWQYVDKQNARSITFEYVMLDGVNDKPEHAFELVRLLQGHPAKVNLIPFNPFPGTQYRRSSPAAIERFRDICNSHGVIATTRRTRGDDIDAACGQLVGRVRDRTTVRLGSKLISVAVET